MPRKEFFPSNEHELENYLAMEEMSARIQAELNGKLRAYP